MTHADAPDFLPIDFGSDDNQIAPEDVEPPGPMQVETAAPVGATQAKLEMSAAPENNKEAPPKQKPEDKS